MFNPQRVTVMAQHKINDCDLIRMFSHKSHIVFVPFRQWYMSFARDAHPASPIWRPENFLQDIRWADWIHHVIKEASIGFGTLRLTDLINATQCVNWWLSLSRRCDPLLPSDVNCIPSARLRLSFRPFPGASGAIRREMRCCSTVWRVCSVSVRWEGLVGK